MSQEVLIHVSSLGKGSWETLSAIVPVITLGPVRPHTHSSGNDLIPNMLGAFPKEAPSECLHELTSFSHCPPPTLLCPCSFISLSLQSLAHTLTSPEKPPDAIGQGLCPTNWTAEMWYLKGMAVGPAVIPRTAAAGQFITRVAYESNCSFISPGSQCKIYSDLSAARRQHLSVPSLEGKQPKNMKARR